MSASMAYRAFLFCKPFIAVGLSALIVVNALVFLALLTRGRFDLTPLALCVMQVWVVVLYLEQMQRTVTVTPKGGTL